jgi:hypothetical protein
LKFGKENVALKRIAFYSFAEISRHSTETAQRLAETNADVWNLKKTLNGNFTRKDILRI